MNHKSISALVLTFLFVGCSSELPKDKNEHFFFALDQVKNDQYLWSYGNGGIYWISNDKVVLDAHIKNNDGRLERGIYEVNVDDGTHTRIAKTQGSFSYCFDGHTLFIKSKNSIDIVNKPIGYAVELVTFFRELSDGINSELRCQSVERPSSDGYRVLYPQDGFLKSDSKGKKYEGNDKRLKGSLDPENQVELVNQEGSLIKKLDLTISQVSTPYYLPYRDAYFGYRIKGKCASMWWLYRDSWKTKTKKQCFGKWAESPSKIIFPTKVGIYVQHTMGKKYKSYFITDSKEYGLETTSSIGGALSPDGCKVAYGSGKLKGNAGTRQILKIFNACKFFEIKGEK